jgi:hypothetical protein
VAVELGGDDGARGACGAVALELGDCGAVAGSTAAELQAMAARVTEIPRNASLIRDPVGPEVDISMSASLAWLCITTRWALGTGSC